MMFICNYSIVYQSFLRQRFCVPAKDLYWFTDKEIENNVGGFCVKYGVIRPDDNWQS